MFAGWWTALLNLLGMGGGAVAAANTGGVVCFTVACNAAVSGTVACNAGVSGTVACNAATAGTVGLKEC